MENIKELQEQEKKLKSQRLKDKLNLFNHLISIVLICLIWYVTIKNIKVLIISKVNIKSFLFIVGFLISYILFNILYFGNLMIDEHHKKERFIRLDVKIVILLSKIISILDLLFGLFVITKFRGSIIFLILLCFLSLILLFCYLSFKMETIINKGKPIKLELILVNITSIIGIILYIINYGFNIPIIF